MSEGGKQVNVRLEPKPAKALARLMKHTGLPATKVLSQLLVDAAAQLRKPKTNKA